MLALALAGMSLWAAPPQEAEGALTQQRADGLRKDLRSADKSIEVAAVEKAVVPVRAVNLAMQFGHNNYPPSAFAERRQGRAQIVAKVGTDGKATSCVVTSSSGHADLDLATCEGVYRASFTPATDHGGEAMVGTFTTAVTWNLVP